MCKRKRFTIEEKKTTPRENDCSDGMEKIKQWKQLNYPRETKSQEIRGAENGEINSPRISQCFDNTTDPPPPPSSTSQRTLAVTKGAACRQLIRAKIRPPPPPGN